MKIALASVRIIDRDINYNLTQMERYMKEAKATGPAMAEGLDYYQGQIITLTESASDKYIFGKLFFATDIVSLDMDTLMP